MLNGPRQLRFQCRDCGKLLAQAVAHVRARPDTPQVDEQFLREWISYDRQRWSAASVEKAQMRAEVEAELREAHRRYLQSDEWRQIRTRVFLRAGGMCEGCGAAEATQVHHLTYQHQGREFLWELVAVCRTCHERVHEISN